MDIISKVLCPSPFASLQDYAEKVQAYLVRIEPLNGATRSGNVEETERIASELLTIGAEARQLANDIDDCLGYGHLLPVSREGLIAVNHVSRSLLDIGQELVGLLQTRRPELPDELREPLDSLLKLAVQVACLSTELVRRLKLLADVAFGGPESERFRVLLRDVDAVKARCDETSRTCRQNLNSADDVMGPSQLVYSTEVVSQLVRLSTEAQHLAHHLRRIIGQPGQETPPLVARLRSAIGKARRRTVHSTDRPKAGDVLDSMPTA